MRPVPRRCRDAARPPSRRGPARNRLLGSGLGPASISPPRNAAQTAILSIPGNRTVYLSIETFHLMYLSARSDGDRVVVSGALWIATGIRVSSACDRAQRFKVWWPAGLPTPSCQFLRPPFAPQAAVSQPELVTENFRRVDAARAGSHCCATGGRRLEHQRKVAKPCRCPPPPSPNCSRSSSSSNKNLLTASR